MTLLYLGILLFGGSHLFSSLAPGVRNRLKAWAGEQIYKGAYSLVSLVGIVLMFWGYAQTRDNGEMLYLPMAGAKHITMLLVLIGVICIASNMRRGYIQKWLQNPFSIGISLWAIGHLLANGKTPVVLIYLVFLIISVIDIVLSMIRGQQQKFEPQLKSDIIAVVAGIVVYALLLLLFHPYIIGVRIVG